MSRFWCCILVCALGVVCLGAEVISTKSKDSTSKDIPLTFTMEKTTWDGKDINIWGKVRNSGTATYKHVKIVLTAKDERGEFLGRNSWTTEPDELGPGQVGLIDSKFVECEKRKPAQIEFQVIGDVSR